jgi:mono/diheme cytochrome c family protein
MTWRAFSVVAAWFVVASTWTHAQAPATKNPLEGDQTAIRSGMGLFRARCADCHGMDAHGVRGPDITQVWASGRTDEGLFTTIKNGIPGTEMPAQPRLFEHETWQILAYLRTLAASSRPEPARGNGENGQKIYQANCVS